MNTYKTETGYYVLKDGDGRVGGKANVAAGKHPVPNWVDMSKSFDVESEVHLEDYDLADDYRTDTS